MVPSPYQNDDIICLSTWGCSIFIFPMGWCGVCEIEFFHMSKNSGNRGLVCKKTGEEDARNDRANLVMDSTDPQNHSEWRRCL